MAKYFPVYKIIESDFRSDQSEPLGTKRKIWVRDRIQQRRWLCKRVRVRETGQSSGEDWAEVIASRLCELLVLPHAHYEFASWDNQRAVVSRSFLWEYGRELRDELRIIDEVLKLPPEASTPARRRRSREFFTIDVLSQIFQEPDLELLPRRDVPAMITTAFDLFVGYLMLDGWIGNTDRHEQNLAIIQRVNKHKTRRFLAPTFDHGSSLGRELTDESRLKLLAEHQAFERYRIGCFSKIHSGGQGSKPLRTIEAFHLIALRNKQAALIWLDKLETISDDDVRRLFYMIPSDLISDTAIELAVKLLAQNKSELMALRERLK